MESFFSTLKAELDVATFRAHSEPGWLSLITSIPSTIAFVFTPPWAIAAPMILNARLGLNSVSVFWVLPQIVWNAILVITYCH